MPKPVTYNDLVDSTEVRAVTDVKTLELTNAANNVRSALRIQVMIRDNVFGILYRK